MSKNKKKNRNYQTTKQQPVKPQKEPISKTTIVLIVAVLLVAIIGAIFIFTDINQNDNKAPIVSTDINSAGNDTEHIAKYLKEKYHMDFTHEFTTSGASIFSADGLPGLIQVFRREVVQELDESRAYLFTDMYADNGYLIVNMQKSVDYYKSKTKIDFGNATFLTYIDIVANPSKVNADTTYEEYLRIIKDVSIPHLIILTDKTMSEEELSTLESEMKALGHPLAVRVFTLDAETQAKMDPGTIMAYGSTHQDVQYYKMLNADHLLD